MNDTSKFRRCGRVRVRMRDWFCNNHIFLAIRIRIRIRTLPLFAFSLGLRQCRIAPETMRKVSNHYPTDWKDAHLTS